MERQRKESHSGTFIRRDLNPVVPLLLRHIYAPFLVRERFKQLLLSPFSV